MIGFRRSKAPWPLRVGVVAVSTAMLAGLNAAEVRAGPMRRMYRRAAGAAFYAAPYYSPRGYAAPVPLASLGPPPASFAPYPAPYMPYGPARRGYPPPYYFFSGILRPGYAPAWSGPFGGTAPDEPPTGHPSADEADGVEPREQLSDQAFVRGLYRDILGREPDEPGMTAWVHALRRGMSRRAATNYFLNSRERPQSTQRQAAPAGLRTESALAGEQANPDAVKEPRPQLFSPTGEPDSETIPPGDQPTPSGTPDVLPEEVPVPPMAIPQRRDREF